MSDDFDILMSAEPDRLTAPPRDLAEIATLVVERLKTPIIEGNLPHLLLLTFQGTEVRTWLLQGTPPVSIDDVVRGLAHHTSCDALVFVFPMPVPREVSADRTVNVAIEDRTSGMDILFALKGRPGDPNATVQLHQRPMGDHRRWLGVPTPWSFNLYRKDAGFGGPSVGEA
jgi:hypothetical protein